MRCVIDTNVLVSAAAFSISVQRQAMTKVLKQGVLLFSEATADELKEVLFRAKFDRYISREDRALFLTQIQSVAEFVSVIQLVRECNDPKDDKFLEVALNGRADLIIAGDTHLLRMHPWREIAILPPSEYLER